MPELPMIGGDFCHDWKGKNADACAPIVEAIRDVFLEMGGAFVDTQGLRSNWTAGVPHPQKRADEVHFCRESLYELGERYYAAFTELR